MYDKGLRFNKIRKVTDGSNTDYSRNYKESGVGVSHRQERQILNGESVLSGHTHTCQNSAVNYNGTVMGSTEIISGSLYIGNVSGERYQDNRTT